MDANTNKDKKAIFSKKLALKSVPKKRNVDEVMGSPLLKEDKKKDDKQRRSS